MNFNQVVLLGRLTRDPELTYLPSNTAVAEFGLAVNRKWRSQSGETKEEVSYFDVRAYGKQAETLNQYVGKGKPLLVAGTLKQDRWEKDGRQHSKVYVVLREFQFIGTRDASDDNQAQSAPQADATEAMVGDDIPF